MKKTIIFIMLILCLTAFFPVEVNAVNNYSGDNVYILAKTTKKTKTNKKTTKKTKKANKKTTKKTKKANKKTTKKTKANKKTTKKKTVAGDSDNSDDSSDQTNPAVTGGASCTDVRDLIHEYWSYVMVLVPILLIVMITLDFFKALAKGDSDSIKKAGSDAVKRTVAAVVLLALPALLGVIFNLVGLPLCV